MNISAIHLPGSQPALSAKKKNLDIASCKNLPTLPHVAMRIIEVALSDDTSLRDLSEVVVLDPALSAKVLATVNSAFYGFQNEVTTLQHAISILGMKAVRNLSLGLLIVQEFSQRGNTLAALASRQLWKRALSAAVIAKMIGQEAGSPQTDEAFLISLLQDIGMLAIMATASEEYRTVLGKDLPHGPELCRAEHAAFGTDHMEAGRILAAKWNFPAIYQNCIGSHHSEVGDVRAETRDDFVDQLVRFSADAACLLTSATDPTETLQLKDVGEKVFSVSGDQFDNVLGQAHSHAVALGGIFNVPMSGLRKYTDLLQQATQKLSELGITYEEALAHAREEKIQAQTVIQELKESNRELKEKVVRDGLTNLFNKRTFLETIELLVKRAVRYKRTLSLLMIDIDRFKRVNDKYGHQIGDEVLKNVALTIQQVARETDIAARYGGEEFAVLLDEAGSNEVKLIAERMRATIDHARFTAGRDELHITVSVGATAFDADGAAVSAELMIGCADKALYQAKQQGRNRACYVNLPE